MSGVPERSRSHLVEGTERTRSKAARVRDIEAKEQLVVELSFDWQKERAWRRRSDDAEGRLLQAIDELLRVKARARLGPRKAEP